MTIQAIVNRIRRGKTLTLTFMTGRVAKTRTKIYANYYTVFNDYIVKSLRQLEEMRKGFFAWDDAYRWAPSKHRNKDVDLIMAMSGKREIDIMWTTTRTNQVDINVRENTEFIWFPFLVDNNRLCVARQYNYYPERGDSDEERTGELLREIRFRTANVFKWYETREEIGELAGS